MKASNFAAALAALLVPACQSAPPEPVQNNPEPAKSSAPSKSVAAVQPTAAESAPPAAPSTAATPTPSAAVVKPSVPVSPDDPLKGVFTLDDATRGLTGTGALVATLDTDQGKLDCKLYSDKAPGTVANFVGLARGLRPYKDPSGQWVKKPAYDGTVFHRIVKGFMIQGGDAKGNGTGEPGYVVADEIWPGAKHDRAGLLCMANRGPNTNGAQFFITDAPAPHLDGGYTIFGECTPEDVIHKIAGVEVVGLEHPKSPPKIRSIKVHRK